MTYTTEISPWMIRKVGSGPRGFRVVREYKDPYFVRVEYVTRPGRRWDVAVCFTMEGAARRAWEMNGKPATDFDALAARIEASTDEEIIINYESKGEFHTFTRVGGVDSIYYDDELQAQWVNESTAELTQFLTVNSK